MNEGYLVRTRVSGMRGKPHPEQEQTITSVMMKSGSLEVVGNGRPR